MQVGYAGDHEPKLCYSIPDISCHISLKKNFRLFHDAFYRQLCIKSKDAKVVIIEDIFSPKIIRDSIFTCLVRELQVSEITVQPDLFMSILGTSRLSGIVVSIGEEECHAVAVYEGRPILNTLRCEYFFVINYCFPDLL
jgi:hypothetical protein